MQFQDLHPSLPSWMTALESRLTELFEGEFSALRQASATMLHSQGKRLRSAMLLLSCACFHEVTARAIDNGCLVELIHDASLIHDDIVDEADTRRGMPSARARWGNKFSVLLGDFFLARVFELAIEDGDPVVLQLLAPTAAEMGRGVILELTQHGLDAGVETYWQVVHGKTATLFATSTAIGAVVGGATREQQQTMRQMGLHFGYAFQLADDLMDLQGVEEATGKPLRVDWQQRRATLPLLLAYQNASPAVAGQIRSLWETDPFTEVHFDMLRSMVDSAGGFEQGWDQVKEYLTKACDCLEALPASTGRNALLRLCTERFPLPVLPSAISS